MNIKVIDATPAHKPVLASLLELYQYDFTEFTDEDVADDGRFGYRYLDANVTEPDRHAFLLRVDGHWAGFALLRRASIVDDPAATDVSEFFVMRKYRRRGIATEFARRVFARFSGHWEVRVMTNNAPALVFWPRVIRDVSAGHFEDRPFDDDRWRAFFFDNAPA
jgi:predicted acetyltransferase